LRRRRGAFRSRPRRNRLGRVNADSKGEHARKEDSGCKTFHRWLRDDYNTERTSRHSGPFLQPPCNRVPLPRIEEYPFGTAAMRIPAITDRTPYNIVLNVRSGAGSAVECRAQMQDILQKAGRAHQFFLVEHAQQLAPILASAVHAACENRGALVGGGGDGTINAAAHSVLEMGLPFGVVPQGTFNYLSRTYSIPSEVQDATLALLRARVRPIQVGVLNDRIFLVNASLGLHPHLLQERDAFARQFGRRRTVALWAGLITLMKGYRQLVLEIEHENGHEEVVRTPTLVIGNNPLQLEQIGISEAEEVQHGQLAA